MPVPYGSMLHIKSADYYLPPAKQAPHRKPISEQKNSEEIFRGRSQENRPLAEKGEDRKCSRPRKKDKTGDSKVESDDSPEIPDIKVHEKKIKKKKKKELVTFDTEMENKKSQICLFLPV